MLRCDECALQGSEGFDHQQWVESVASATDLPSLRSCLAQLEAALVSSNNSIGHTTPGTTKAAKGAAHTRQQQQQLLSPDWSRIIAVTPAVKGAWLQCGAEVAAAVLDPDRALSPNLTGTPAAAAAAALAAAAAAEEGADPAAAAAAAAMPDQAAVQQQQELQQQKAQARASLDWLPATVPALSLRLAALDACICYPQLREGYGFDSGRDLIVRYRYIVKPCPIFDPPTNEQLLLQEKEAAAAAKAKEQQEKEPQQQQTGSGSASAAAGGEDQEASPESKQQQQQQQDEGMSEDKQAEQQTQNGDQDQQQQQQDKSKPPSGALDILALVHPTPPPRPKQQPQQQQQQPEQQKQQQQQPPRKQAKPREGVPTVESVLAKPLRVAYGYSLQGRGLLQLIRGLPPYPDWVSHLDAGRSGAPGETTTSPHHPCVSRTPACVLVCFVLSAYAVCKGDLFGPGACMYRPPFAWTDNQPPLRATHSRPPPSSPFPAPCV